MVEEIETTEAGDRIYRHEKKAGDRAFPTHSNRNLESIEAHVESYIGKIETVYHEIISEHVHLDVLFVTATEERPYHVLVTSGISDLPMNVPDGMQHMDRVELLVALPASWPLHDEAFKDEANYWPIRWLKQVGRLPHEYDSWIGWGHTNPNGDPAEAIASTKFSGVMLCPAYWLNDEFTQFQSSTGDNITFFDMVPLYQEEMDFKLKEGAEKLEDALLQINAPVFVDISRENAVAKKSWLPWKR